MTSKETRDEAVREIATLIEEYDPNNSDWYFRRTVIREILNRLASASGGVDAAAVKALSLAREGLLTSSPEPVPLAEKRDEAMRAAITAYLSASTRAENAQVQVGQSGVTDGIEWVVVPRGRYRELVAEELWNAFNCGIERGGKWMDGGRSEGEWLIRELGLPSDDGWHDAEVMKGMMAAAVDRAMLAAAGGENA